MPNIPPSEYLSTRSLSRVFTSTSDKLPPLERFLPRMAGEHREAIRLYLRSGRNQNMLDDFTNLGYTPQGSSG